MAGILNNKLFKLRYSMLLLFTVYRGMFWLGVNGDKLKTQTGTEFKLNQDRNSLIKVIINPIRIRIV